MASVADASFSHPRLAQVYDALDGARSDIKLYVDIASEVGAGSVLDIGCGTGELACALTERGLEVTGVDPAHASIAVAESKAHADRVRWIVGEADSFDGPTVDLVTMTGNVAQVFVSDDDWMKNLNACRSAVRAGGWIVFESRNPNRQAWLEWTPERTSRRVVLPGVGQVNAHCEVTEVRLPLVSFSWTYTFEDDEAVLRSESTIRFRTRMELEEALPVAGFALRNVRDAPDRPGTEMVFLAQAV